MGSRTIKRSLSGLVALLLSGCAGTQYATIPNILDPLTEQQSAATKQLDATTDGIRYYHSAPFVLVYTDGKGGLTSEWLWLADTTAIRVLKPYAVAAKNNATYSFADGVLTDAKSEVDETIVPAAVVTAAKDAVLARFTAADQGNADGTPREAVPPPALFRVVVLPTGEVALRGSYGQNAKGEVVDIDITVSQPAKAEGDK